MIKHYLGYAVKKSGFNWTVYTPSGALLTGEAASLKTAFKWIEQHLAEVRSRNFGRV